MIIQQTANIFTPEMKKKNSVDDQIKNIHNIMDKLDQADRELLSDKMISYLLFNAKEHEVAQKKTSAERKKNFENTELTKREKTALKKLVLKTDELRDLLGDNPPMFL